jgi:hypothetical protein
MFSREDIELIVYAMYQDELRDICERMTVIQANLAEVQRLNSSFKRSIERLFLIWEKIKYIFKRDRNIDGEILSTVVLSLTQKEIAYKIELKKLNLQKKEVEYIYDYIIYKILPDDLVYAQDLILMRSVRQNEI